MTPDELGQAIELGREQAGVEFKPPCLRGDKGPFAQVARALMAMANRADGGRVVVGVEERENRLYEKGLTQEQADSWLVHDHLGDALAVYADPPFDFECVGVELNGARYVVIRAFEFRDTPIVCKKSYARGDGAAVLREGATYVRPRRKPETVEVSTAADMRDLIDLAAQKRLRALLATVQRAGGSVVTGSGGPPAPTTPGLFTRQLGDLP